jgi:hypothetical protein
MQTVDVDIQKCFEPLFGQSPWRARGGVGSFLTFDFGGRIRRDGRQYGQWHLWIYQANWELKHGDQPLAGSNSKRHLIDLAVRRLERVPFTGVEVDRELNTNFTFGDFLLKVTPADYLDQPDKRDAYWLFFVPGDEVLTVGPGGINLGSSNK